MTEYKTTVTACPMIPSASAPVTIFFGFLPISSSSYKSMYPCLSLYDGGGKDLFFMISNHIYMHEKYARSGEYQISNFFEHFRCSLYPSAQKNRFFTVFPSTRCPVLDLNIFNNLMNALTAQIKLVCDLAERRTRSAHLQNFVISVRICCWTRLKWTPLPTGNSLDSGRALIRKLIFSAPLANITNPSPQSDIIIFNNFSVDGWNITMTFSRRKLKKCFNIGIESSHIIHEAQISTARVPSRKQLTFNYLLQQNLTSGLQAIIIGPRTGEQLDKSV